MITSATVLSPISIFTTIGPNRVTSQMVVRPNHQSKDRQCSRGHPIGNHQPVPSHLAIRVLAPRAASLTNFCMEALHDDDAEIPTYRSQGDENHKEKEPPLILLLVYCKKTPFPL